MNDDRSVLVKLLAKEAANHMIALADDITALAASLRWMAEHYEPGDELEELARRALRNGHPSAWRVPRMWSMHGTKQAVADCNQEYAMWQADREQEARTE